MMANIDEIKEIYESYGYEHKSIQAIDVFEYRHGRYFGADIFEKEHDVNSVVNSYRGQGFATSVKKDFSIETIENELFDSFFQVDNYQRKIKREYNAFIRSQIKNFENVQYEYVNGNYSCISFDSEGIADECIDEKMDVVDKVIDFLKLPGANLVIIEAAAGYGKTCTANEIVFRLCNSKEKILPLHIELSKNREARIFKHILQNEIESQFQNAVTSKTVERQIERGKIPVIIDGFDELLSKDCTKVINDNKATDKLRDAESMLNTIIGLLKNNAKVIITSRKTALFNGDDFYSWILNSKEKFNTHRISMAEPDISNWLDKEKIVLLEANHFPLKNVANPVLLSYLKYSTYERLKTDFAKTNNVVDNYFSFLLDREKERQKIKWEKHEQLEILEKLVRSMCEMDFKSDEKSFIKALILEGNESEFNDYLTKYQFFPKPTHDDLAETLSNHALLDRKRNNTIGFVNDFVFGFLIGKNFIEGKFEKQYPENFEKIVSQDFALLAISAFRFQPSEEKRTLFSILTSRPFDYDNEFCFFRDLFLENKFGSDSFGDLTIKNIYVTQVDFIPVDCKVRFSSMVFDSCTFEKCKFEKASFRQTALINCSFVMCEWIHEINDSDRCGLCISGGTCDNDFIGVQYEDMHALKGALTLNNINVEKSILEMFIRPEQKLKPMRKIEEIYEIFDSSIGEKIIDKTIKQLREKLCLAIDGNKCFIQKNGISLYNKNYRGK